MGGGFTSWRVVGWLAASSSSSSGGVGRYRNNTPRNPRHDVGDRTIFILTIFKGIFESNISIFFDYHITGSCDVIASSRKTWETLDLAILNQITSSKREYQAREFLLCVSKEEKRWDFGAERLQSMRSNSNIQVQRGGVKDSSRKVIMIHTPHVGLPHRGAPIKRRFFLYSPPWCFRLTCFQRDPMTPPVLCASCFFACIYSTY